MSEAWRTWVALWRLREPPQVLAVVRILVAALLLYDLAVVARLDLIEPLWAPHTAGGIPRLDNRETVPLLYQLLPTTAATARLAVAALAGSLLALLLGLATPLAALLCALLSAQLNEILPAADRGIDDLLRNVFVLLAVSPAGRALSLDAALARRLGRPFDPQQPAWPRHLLVLQLAVLYFLAGVQKTALAWTPMGGFSALYIVLQDPAVSARPPPDGILTVPLSQVATATTWIFEWSAGLLPLCWWYRFTADRPGRLRAFCQRWQPQRAWMLVGVMLHLGIAATMQLGIFPWAVLALYPAFLHPEEWRGLGARLSRR